MIINVLNYPFMSQWRKISSNNSPVIYPIRYFVIHPIHYFVNQAIRYFVIYPTSYFVKVMNNVLFTDDTSFYNPSFGKIAYWLFLQFWSSFTEEVKTTFVPYFLLFVSQNVHVLFFFYLRIWGTTRIPSENVRILY